MKFEQSITEEIKRLRKSGLNLNMFFDKGYTALSRTKQREEQWASFYDYCEEGVQCENNDRFPLPALSKQQLIATLQLRCACQVLRGEADQEIAKFVSSSNAAGGGKAEGEQQERKDAEGDERKGGN